MTKGQGYVFLNQEGLFAKTCVNTGFGTDREVIVWILDLNQATVFHSGLPWDHPFRRHLKGALKDAQAVQAIEKRTVMLTQWEGNDDKA